MTGFIKFTIYLFAIVGAILVVSDIILFIAGKGVIGGGIMSGFICFLIALVFKYLYNATPRQ